MSFRAKLKANWLYLVITILACGLYAALVTWTRAGQPMENDDWDVFFLVGVCSVGFFLGWRWAVATALASAGINTLWHSDSLENPLLNAMVFASHFLVLGTAGWLCDRVRLLTKERIELAREIADKQKALHELQETKEQLALLLRRSPACLYSAEITPPYKATYVSENVSSILGLEKSELLTRPTSWQERLHPEDQARVSRFISELLANGEAAWEYRFRRPSGEYIWVFDSARIARDGNGSAISASGFIIDINARKTAEAAMQTQRDLAVALSLQPNLRSGLKSLLDAAVELEGIDSGGIYLASKDGSLELVTHHGLSEEFVKTVQNKGAASPEAEFVRKGLPVYASVSDLSLPVEILKREGLESVAFIPLHYQGQVLGSLNTASHTRKTIPAQTRRFLEALAAHAVGAISHIRAQEALRRSENHLHAIIDGTPVILFSGNAEGRIVFEDGQALRALKLKPGAHQGRLLWEFSEPRHLVSGYTQKVLGGEEFYAQVSMKDVPFDCWFSPEKNAEGAITGFFVVATNASKRQRLEKQILDISDREQARIGQDIHDGLCQQLVSLGFDVTALRDRIGMENHAAIAVADRMSSLLDTCITEARQLARGLFPIRLAADGLPSALEEMASNIGGRFRVACELEVSGNIPELSQTEATHLYRIAQEAVMNAVKHANPTKVRIALLCAPGSIRLEVVNDGRSLDSTRAKGGMGLSIMSYRARMIGGSLQVCSVNGERTVVRCNVPRPAG